MYFCCNLSVFIMLLLQKDARIVYLKTCASTQDIFKDFSEEEFDLVYTFNQTQGKGQYGNKWQSEQGKSVALSILLDEKKIMVNEICLRYFFALILRDFIQKYVTEKILIKFPNDLYCRTQKLCGILIEKYHKKYIVGIGINVLKQDFSTLPKATSISNFSTNNIDIELFTSELIQYFYQEFSFTDDEIINKSNEYLYKKNQVLVIEYQQKIVNAKVKNIDKNGNIFFEIDEDKIIKLQHKEFSFLD